MLHNQWWEFNTHRQCRRATDQYLQVGKLSDVFGRKGVLLTCYAIFGFGTLMRLVLFHGLLPDKSNYCSGLGRTLWQVILGRAIAGVGGSGMTVIVSIIVTGNLVGFCLL